MSKYAGVVVDYLNPELSDHSPLLLKCAIGTNLGGRPFKFYNFMTEYEEFTQVVHDCWLLFGPAS